MFGFRCLVVVLQPRASRARSCAELTRRRPHSAACCTICPARAPLLTHAAVCFSRQTLSVFAPRQLSRPPSWPPPVGERACCPPHVSRPGGHHWRVAERRRDERKARSLLGGCCGGVSARRRARAGAGASPTPWACIPRRASALCAASRPRRRRSAAFGNPKTLCSQAGRAAGGRRAPAATRQLTRTALLRRRGRQMTTTSCSARFGSCTPSVTCHALR